MADTDADDSVQPVIARCGFENGVCPEVIFRGIHGFACVEALEHVGRAAPDTLVSATDRGAVICLQHEFAVYFDLAAGPHRLPITAALFYLSRQALAFKDATGHDADAPECS